MAKIADRYLKVDSWSVVEEGFDIDRNRVSESIFSLGNEYMGVRGYFEEGYSGDHLVGSYFNGVYEEMPVQAQYKGIIRSLRFMVNAVDWLHTRIQANGESLDLAKSKVSHFSRKLDFKTGLYTRLFQWHLQDGSTIDICFERLVSMNHSHLGAQRITFHSIDFEGELSIQSGLDFNTIHEDQRQAFWKLERYTFKGEWVTGFAKTKGVGNLLCTSMRINEDEHAVTSFLIKEADQYIGLERKVKLKKEESYQFEKIVVNVADKNKTVTDEEIWSTCTALAQNIKEEDFQSLSDVQEQFWERVWATSDIEIDGDLENQQGIRFCIFQLYQTYRGENSGFNIGAKGLTGEAYRGLAFWDTETYCLPFYIINNPAAARSLLQFRYRSLPYAMQRAKDIGCEGAFYPIATIDGTESCDLWQHSNLQLQVGTAVGYGIWHYSKITNDKAFLYREGMEMLIQINRFNASRGQWGQETGQFGYFGVMGPDEFQLMVNNNCYLNFMAKKMFQFAAQVYMEMKQDAGEELGQLQLKLNVTDREVQDWLQLAERMRIPYDEQRLLFEQHDGFFNMPHIDVDTIPVEQFPLYHSWAYDRLYRYDMVKQPDVLLFMFLYSSEFSKEVKQANYEYYEPRTIHESSLSPSIHSIFAAELGKHEEAYQFFEFASRLDLDNYNRNTREGLHTTSIAAAWLNIVYGFGGLRSDGDMLQLNPIIPSHWNQYSFKFTYQNSVVSVTVSQEKLQIKTNKPEVIQIRIYDRQLNISDELVELEIVNN
ncbi:MAG TPA: family 65 glycosyl hydrolase [Candidatus Paenibacillus intestinavium]|nr:family 65 glycosyl hydrolase [Candidatus Paenibacillus intestinavium]